MTSAPDNRPGRDLTGEGEAFYQLLFGEKAPTGTGDAYARACRILFPSEEHFPLEPLPRSRSALEALELATRLSKPLNQLTRRVHIILYIAEADPGHFSTFVPQRSHRIGAWPRLGFHFIRTIVLFIRGTWLRRRYPID